jgi:hypothetical protein
MPRKSSEAVAGAWWRAHNQHGDGSRPRPPSWLSAAEAQTFREIVGSRAPDLFGPGNLELLAHFCVTHHHVMKLRGLLEGEPLDCPRARVLQRQILAFMGLAASLAGKLALLPRHQHGHRSGVLNERHSPTGDNGTVLPWSEPDRF